MFSDSHYFPALYSGGLRNHYVESPRLRRVSLQNSAWLIKGEKWLENKLRCKGITP